MSSFKDDICLPCASVSQCNKSKVLEDLDCLFKDDAGSIINVSPELSSTFVHKSPIPLRVRQGGRRGRRSLAESLGKRSPKQKSIVNFVKVSSGVKRPLIEEVNTSFDNTFAQPVKRSTVEDAVQRVGCISTGSEESAFPSVCVASSDSQHSVTSVSPPDYTLLCLSPSAVTSSPVKMDKEGMSEVKGLFNDLMIKFNSMQEAFSKQSAESDKKLDALNQVVSNLDGSISAKVLSLEQRLARCEKAIEDHERAGGGRTQGDRLCGFADEQSPFFADFLRMRKVLLNQSRDAKRCNAIIRGAVNTSTTPLSSAIEFFKTFFNYDNCVVQARWLSGKRGGLLVTFADWQAKQWVFKNKREALGKTNFSSTMI